MKSPAVQYVRTPDGISIAYTDVGEGPTFVFLPTFLNHVQYLWEGLFPSAGSLIRDLATRFRVINYDGRGQGLSTRGISPNVTLDDFLLDLDTVQGHLGLNNFVLLGSCSTAFLAVHYALRHPEKVQALVLVNAALSWDAWRLSSVYERLPAEDWELFLYNQVPQDFSPEATRRFVETMKECMTQSDYLAGVPAWQSARLEDRVAELHTPTLVLHSKDFRLRAVQGPLDLAQRLPNGRLILMNKNKLFGEPGEASQAIDGFLADLESNEMAGSNHGVGPVPHMTARELEVLRLIARGATNHEIAEELLVSVRTVERHITHLYGKIGARGKADATAYAMRRELA